MYTRGYFGSAWRRFVSFREAHHDPLRKLSQPSDDLHAYRPRSKSRVQSSGCRGTPHENGDGMNKAIMILGCGRIMTMVSGRASST